MQTFTNPLQDMEKMSDEELLKICETAEKGDIQALKARVVLKKRENKSKGNIAKEKTLEEMSNEELLNFLGSFNFLGNYSYEENQKREKARKILERREEEREAQRKKALDNGSVKGLILSGDYTEVACGVIIQNIFSKDSITWILRGARFSSDIVTATKKGSAKDWGWDHADECAHKIVTICRRKLKQEDIILCGVDSIGDNVENGIVLTEKRIYTFYKSKPEYIIEYSEIDDVDYTDDSVIIKTSTGETAKLYCGTNSKYSDDIKKHKKYAENMYNLIMDIKDRLEES